MSFFKSKRATQKVSEPSKDGQIDFILLGTDVAEGDEPLIVKRAVDLLPEWYKKLETTFQHGGREEYTAKRCIPLLDVFTTGYVFVTTRDYTFSKNSVTGFTDITTKGGFVKPPVTMHPREQLGGIDFAGNYEEYAFKWLNPYIVKTPKGYSSLFTQPFNRPELPFTTLSGVVDTDIYFQPVQFPFILKKDFEGTIPAGTPIMQVVPFKRDDWSHTIYDKVSYDVKYQHDVLNREYEKSRYDKDGTILGSIYKKHYRKPKKYR